jgi:hypothetical protein
MPGMAALAKFGLSLLGSSDALNAHVTRGITRVSEQARRSPQRLDFMIRRVYPLAGRANDLVLWPLYSMAFSVVSAVRRWTGL